MEKVASVQGPEEVVKQPGGYLRREPQETEEQVKMPRVGSMLGLSPSLTLAFQRGGRSRLI